MTDKQIIIDGVDVAECEYFNRFRSICHNKNLCCDCKENPNCYYKQLKRKEQKCEQLKAEFDKKELIFAGIETSNRILIEKNNKLKQTLIDIIRFLKEDKKFARYSGYPIVSTSIVLEEIEKILKENDIKISEVENDR